MEGAEQRPTQNHEWGFPMRFAHYALIVLILFGLGISSLSAEARYVELSKKGRKFVSVSLNTSEPRPSELIFYIASTANSTQRFDFSLSSNAPITASIDYKFSPKRAKLLSESSNNKGWIAVKFYADGKVRKTLDLGSGNDNNAADNVVGDSGSNESSIDSLDPNCGCLNEETIRSILVMYESMGVKTTRAEFCKEVDKQAGSPTSCGSALNSREGDGSASGSTGDSSTVSGFGFLEKDACSKKLYPVALRINLNKISDADFKKGVTIAAKMSFEKYVLPKEIILKRSDGGIYPNALIALLPPVSSYMAVEKERKEIVVWKRNKPVYRNLLSKGDMALGWHRALYAEAYNSRYRNKKVNFQVISPFPGSSSYYSSSSLHAYSRCIPLVDRRVEVHR